VRLAVAVVTVALVMMAAPGEGSAGTVGAGPAGAPAGTSGYTFLSAVSCPSPSFCMAVGVFTDSEGRGRALAERWNGTSWSIVPAANRGGPRSNDALWSVWCVSATRCSAVGDAFGASVPLAEEWNGSAWSLVPAPRPRGDLRATLRSVSCTTASSCFAAGSVNDNSGLPPATLIERWNGSRWTFVPSPNPNGAAVSNLWGISCASATTCTAVGDSAGSTSASETTLVESWNGTAWKIIASPGVPGRQTALFGVDCMSAGDCTAGGAIYDDSSGFTATPLVETERNGSWQVTPIPHPAGSYDQLGGVACISAARCTAVGSTESFIGIRTLVESGNAGTWSIVPSPDAPGPLSALGGISCSSATRCMAVGDNDPGTGVRLPFSALWNGKAWTIIPAPNP
jgi:hypothetical protein